MPLGAATPSPEDHDLVAGLRLTGMATMVLDGPINREAFQAHVEQVLVRELRSGDIVTMDNLSSHKGVAIRQAIEAAGKPAKVAITAIMRKLLLLANALVRDGRTWSPKPS